MEKCIVCRGRTENQLVEHVRRWNGQLYLFRNVPAEVCTQCHEAYFGPEALKAMDRVVLEGTKPQEHVEVPVFSL